MNPVLVLQHHENDGPAYFGSWLQRHGIGCDVRNCETGDPYPDGLDGYSGLAILGGEMSANDPLPPLRQAERLVREAIASGVPVIGHCLGGQLMARALGARVITSPAPEIGWQSIDVLDNPQARAWFGSPGAMTVFQWHFDAFELPPGAEQLASSPACAHQAFSLGPHLAMQFHVELDAEKLEAWSRSQEPGFMQAQRMHHTVQTGETMRSQALHHLARQQALADALYRRWWQGALHIRKS
jgi:GMP synthase-like glutamine amidotransferase